MKTTADQTNTAAGSMATYREKTNVDKTGDIRELKMELESQELQRVKELVEQAETDIEATSGCKKLVIEQDIVSISRNQKDNEWTM